MNSIRKLFVKLYRILRHWAGLVIKRIIYFSYPKRVMSATDSDKRTLYIDVTGTHFLKNSRINHKLVYTRAFKGFLSCDDDSLVQFSSGDVYFCLYLTMDTIYNKRHLKIMQKNGVEIYFMLYDLIPLHYPSFYTHEFVRMFRKYVNDMLAYTGILTDSKAVIDDLCQYMQDNPVKNVNPDLVLDHVWLGSDFSYKRGMENLVQGKVPEFLMVSTCEPRKKYDQVLEAFELLWKKGVDVNLRIVGRPGWKNLKVFKTLSEHTELNKRLFWYKTGISDDELSKLYEKCDAVIFASLEEGYGLAVVEAASYGKPVILRDIPVFREIAGDSAYYFSGLEGKNISDAVEEFMEQQKKGDVKLPVVKSNSWEEFTNKVLSLIWDEK